MYVVGVFKVHSTLTLGHRGSFLTAVPSCTPGRWRGWEVHIRGHEGGAGGPQYAPGDRGFGSIRGSPRDQVLFVSVRAIHTPAGAQRDPRIQGHSPRGRLHGTAPPRLHPGDDATLHPDVTLPGETGAGSRTHYVIHTGVDGGVHRVPRLHTVSAGGQAQPLIIITVISVVKHVLTASTLEHQVVTSVMMVVMMVVVRRLHHAALTQAQMNTWHADPWCHQQPMRWRRIHLLGRMEHSFEYLLRVLILILYIQMIHLRPVTRTAILERIQIQHFAEAVLARRRSEPMFLDRAQLPGGVAHHLLVFSLVFCIFTFVIRVLAPFQVRSGLVVQWAAAAFPGGGVPILVVMMVLVGQVIVRLEENRVLSRWRLGRLRLVAVLSSSILVESWKHNNNNSQ